MNPFITAGYNSPEYFCNRKEETKRLLSSIRNNRNVTLYSFRKLGKTALLNHVMHKIKTEKGTTGIFIDLYPTKNLNDLVSEFTNSILVNLYSKPGKAFLQLKNFFKGIIPAIKFDKLTGEPQFELNFRSVSESESTLKGLFSYLKERSKKEKIVVILDEFQQITKYPETNIEAILRSEIQHFTNVVFIFSGSNKSLITSMFNKYNRPFYMSTEMLELKKIKKEEYIEFIIDKFSGNNIKIDSEIAEYIYDWADGYTFNIQHICNKLFGFTPKNINKELVNKQITDILYENESIFLEYRNFITIQQWNLAEAIAKEGKVNMPTSKDFISKYSLGTPSTVKSSINALIRKDLVHKDRDNYQISDLYFSRWLERL